MQEPHCGRTSTIRRSTTRTSSTTPPRSRRSSSTSLDEVDPGAAPHLREARHLARRAEAAHAASPWMRSSTASRWPRPSRTSWPSWASSSARSPKRCTSIRSWCEKYLGSRGAVQRQLLRGPELGGLQRRLVLLHPQGRALPDGAVDLLPHQRRGDRPVRADADHRRGRRLRQLPGRLHRPDARREPAARRRGRAGGGRREVADQVLDRAELVSRRQGRQGRHLQLRHQARRLPRPGQSKISWTQVETGSAITWKYPSCILQGDDSVGEFYSVAADQPSPAGRHRHEDDPHRQEHEEHDRVEGHLGRQGPEHATAAW